MRTKRKTQWIKITVFALLVTTIFACGQSNYNEELPIAKVDVTEKYEAVEEITTTPSNTVEMVPAHLKMIKSGSARYKVQDVNEAMVEVKKIAAVYGGYISDLRFENSLYQKQNRFTIKVPNQNFSALMDTISGVAIFTEYENITTKDVTEEYIDLQSRLKTKLEVKERYENILRTNAKTVEDILATEEKLRALQEEIEAAQGRLKYLTNKVAYSTLQVDIYEKVEYKEKPKSYTKSFTDKAEKGFTFGWQFIEAIFIGLIHIWPLLLGAIVVIFVLKKVFKKK